MSTDRELLENAAKAAGYGGVINFGDEIGVMVSCGPSASKFQPWNPLTDDGDALRLAVKLRIGICYHHADDNTAVSALVSVAFGHSFSESHESLGNDPAAATRRAIVRAASSIGGKMT